VELSALRPELHIDRAVVGSYQRAGDRLRITARVVDAATGEALAEAKADGLLQQVFELQDGQVVGAQRSTLVISKVGVEADIYDFARQRSALYGLLAVVMSVTLGWLAGVIFRRG